MPRPSQSLQPTQSPISRQQRVWLFHFNANLGQSELDSEEWDRIVSLPITGLVLPKNLARTYSQRSSTIPLVVHLNAKVSSPLTDQALAPLTCTVAEAAGLGAQAVMYTAFVGSIHHLAVQGQLKDLKKQARHHRLPLIIMTKLAGLSLKQHRSANMLAYAATVAKTWAVPYVCLPSSSDGQQAKIADILGKTHLVADITSANSTLTLLDQTRQVMASGSAGIMIDQTTLDYLESSATAKLSQLVYGLT